MDGEDDGEDRTAPSETKAPIVRLAPDHRDLDTPTNIPTVRNPETSHMDPKPHTRNNPVSYKTTAQGDEARDLRAETRRQRNSLPEEKPKSLHSLNPMTPKVMEHDATTEGLDRDDARTHNILTQMFAESRNIGAADSSHPSHQSIDHDLVDLLEDDERILGCIKEMKEAEYPKLLDIAIIIRGFEQRMKRLEYGSSEEAVLEEIARDASPTL